MQRLEILSTEAALLQAKLSQDAWKLQGQAGDRLASAQKMGAAVMDSIGTKQDNIRNALDRYRDRLETKAGNFQDLLAEVMDARAEKVMDKLGLGHF